MRGPRASASASPAASGGGGVGQRYAPFTRAVPAAPSHRLLFLGDSTCLGYGAESNTHSVAGYFGRDLPRADIANYGRNGATVGDTLALVRARPEVLRTRGEAPLDAAVLLVGANDILRLTSPRRLERDLTALVGAVTPRARHTVLVAGGNLGEALVLPAYLRPLLTWSSSRVHATFAAVAARTGVVYVPGFQAPDARLRDPRNFCLDLLHPSARGYHYFYEAIRAALDARGFAPS
jgi:lysophospholipase L1-like esterase